MPRNLRTAVRPLIIVMSTEMTTRPQYKAPMSRRSSTIWYSGYHWYR